MHKPFVHQHCVIHVSASGVGEVFTDIIELRGLSVSPLVEGIDTVSGPELGNVGQFIVPFL